MNPGTPVALAATALISVAIGWWLHDENRARAPSAGQLSAAVAPAAPANTAQDRSGPLIAVSSDGIVTLRVEQQPLEWVLEQIALQAGWPGLLDLVRLPRVAAAPAEAAVEPVVAEVPARSAQQASELLQTIRYGGESDRFDGLLLARNEHVSLSDELLKSLFETDASPRVRLLAFEAYLEPRADDLAATRSALEAALYVPDSGIQREARLRLDELAQSERIDAASPQTAAP